MIYVTVYFAIGVLLSFAGAFSSWNDGEDIKLIDIVVMLCIMIFWFALIPSTVGEFFDYFGDRPLIKGRKK